MVQANGSLVVSQVFAAILTSIVISIIDVDSLRLGKWPEIWCYEAIG